MSKILLLSMPSHGHMNPLLGLAAQLIKKGEEVAFFTSVEFKEAVEEIGAEFEYYKEDLNLFKKRTAAPPDSSPAAETQKPKPGLIGAFLNPVKFIDAILDDIKGRNFDYLVCSAAYPYATVIGQILNIPVVSSYAVFATIKELMDKNTPGKGLMGLSAEFTDEFKTVRQDLIEKYQVQIPENIIDLLFNKGDLNIIYTSKYFVPHPENYDDSFIFIGPPIFDKKYNVDFPFEKLEGKKVVYISLGTIFGNHSADLNQLFFDSFADTDAIVVMAAYDVELSKYKVPDNFIIRSFVPQLELLKYATVAITHAGMNSIGDLLYHKVPFVSVPLGADQFYMANRAQELDATIVLDVDTLTPDILTDAVEKVLTTPTYRENIEKISDSFIEAGGYKKAVEEIFELKKLKGLTG
ncbi:macrolide family glycosyltransferase [Mucilaginibacter dorajii]|uniref:Glycosyltransferase n=1 Tax=Mucilaginibacter dorajii TaxID=692994 RepID=A0ABP7P1T0_9SPHI|nr:macrolide family glycosyltransferase [Mucilaginibacter dorajii]MCS3737052.1 MGT family glycosyltransferase [Mucilaginibacter dorajii]